MALTIYERHGGFPVVRKVVAEFYERVLDSERIAHYFEEIDMARLMDHQTRFVSFLMGGPAANYSDEHLRRVHTRFEISLTEFDEIIELLTETLEDFDFTKDEISQIERELRSREPAIVSGR